MMLYVTDRLTPLARLADQIGKGGFYRLGEPRAGRDDNPSLGTGAYALDQSWHHGWLPRAAAAAAVVVLAGCGAVDTTALGTGGNATVLYEVSGPKTAGNITYSTDGNSIAQDNGVGLPWKKEVQFGSGFAVATLSAQNAGKGDITCRITVDGTVVKELTSSGEYAVVSCTSDPL